MNPRKRQTRNAIFFAQIVQPVLYAWNSSTNTCSFTWSGASPFQWQGYFSTTIGGPFANLNTFSGTARTFSTPHHPGYWYIFGTDSSGARVTNDSNIFLCTP